MRNHAGFVVAVAAALLALGFGFIGIGLAQAQADSARGASLDTWGNTWFLLGFCLVLIGAAALVISILMYTGRLRMGPKDQLRAGQKLPAGRSLCSPSGRFRLDMQEDGNLVVYLAERRQPLWASETPWTGAKYVEMQKDGNLVLYARDGRSVWATQTEGRGGKCLVMQDDGNLVIYADEGRPIWATNTVTF
jgi:hypothetical protein